MTGRLTALACAIDALGIATFAGLAISPANADSHRLLNCISADVVGLAPQAASTITLGTYTGVAYYTIKDSGYRLVATVAPGEGGAPIRLISTLANGQRVILSVPQAVGLPALEVEFQRCGNNMVVRGPASLPAATAIVE